MTYAENLGLFTALVFGIIIVPGMDMLFVLTNSLTGGQRAGLSATAGIMLGGVFHTIFGTLAVGLVLQYLPWAFKLMMVAGCGYMMWIGLQLLMSSIRISRIEQVQAKSLLLVFWEGFLTCVLNPKAYMFVFAVYPQFLSPRYGAILPQAVAMGAVTIAFQALVYGGLSVAAAAGAGLLTRGSTGTVYAGRAAGLMLMVAAAVTLAGEYA
jgi:threonine/homoserine/homoserine lactone efflux protein